MPADDQQQVPPTATLQQLALSSAVAEEHETPAALHNTACLAATFSWLDSEQSLLQCSAVCRLWQSVLEADDIWRRVYLRALPQPLRFERASSYKQQFRRLRGVLSPDEVQPAALKGSVLCYNVQTGRLVSYNARQRMLSVMAADGAIQSEVVADAEGAAGTSHRPLLASTGSELVVLAAADGALQLWDASSCRSCGVLGQHGSFVTSLSASGTLVASSCSREMRLWDVDSKQCLYTVPIGLPLPSPVLEPHVAICHEQHLLALANCSAPAPCSVVKVYSTHPAPSSKATSPPAPPQHFHPVRRGGRDASHSGSGAASTSTATTAAAAAAAAAVSVVGGSSCPGSTGAMLLKELPVNAAADMKLSQGLLLVASCFHGRAVSTNSPFRSERPYTVVVNVWETRTWQLTRLISPRLWTDTPMFSMQGTPLISITQGVVLCATLRPGSNNAFPSCNIHALQLPPAVATAGVRGGCSSAAAEPRAGPPLQGGGSSSSSQAAAAGAGRGAAQASAASSSSSSIGTGAVAQGRIAVATAGGVGPVGLSANNTVMLSVSDQERSSWSGAVPLVDDTGGRLTVMLTTPTQLVMATENGQVSSCQLLSTPPPAQQPPVREQQEGGDRGVVAASSQGQVSPVVHVVAAQGSSSRLISLDL